MPKKPSPAPTPIRSNDLGIVAILLGMGGRLAGPPEDVDDRLTFEIVDAPADALEQINASPMLKATVRWLPQLAGMVRQARDARRRGGSRGGSR